MSVTQTLDAAALIGIWRLVGASATDGDGNPLPPPYGGTGLGTVTFDGTRMVAAICQGEVAEGEAREYSAYCGRYRFDGGCSTMRLPSAVTRTC